MTRLVFTAYGLVVELNNGRVDTIFASADGATPRTAPGGFEFAVASASSQKRTVK